MAAADAVIARLAGRQKRIAATWQLEPLGVDRHALYRRVADGRLMRIHRGVYAVGTAPLSPSGRRMAAVLACGPGALLTARDAAALRNLRPSDRGTVEVLVECAGRARRKGIQVHRGSIHRDDRDLIDGIPVASLARTLLDLAAVVEPKQVRRAYERAERLRVLDVRTIKQVLNRSNGHRGTGILAALLDYDPAPAAEALSEPERLLVDLVRDVGLPTPQVNVLVEGYLVDAFWPAHGLVVEVQTHAYHSDKPTFERDHRKLADIRSAGFDLLPVTDLQIEDDPGGVASLIAKLLPKSSPVRR